MLPPVSAKDLARGVATAAAMLVALGGAARTAVAVWLKLARPECFRTETPAAGARL